MNVNCLVQYIVQSRCLSWFEFSQKLTLKQGFKCSAFIWEVRGYQ